MAASALMFQGTGSDVGKSVLVAGLCRALTLRGLNVRPFKPQNMSNNAAVTSDGGEIGRAQALQARACNVPATVHMNPVLLKPESETGAQVIVRGQRYTTAKARDYGRLKPKLLADVLESYEALRAEADVVLVEGAGSPAEINLRQCDIANMGFAHAAGVPVILAADIDRGGVIAQVVGTRQVMDRDDCARVAGFLINKFRGDPGLFADGYAYIENATGWRGYGVIPWLPECAKLPAEDAVQIASGGDGSFKIVVPHLSRIANFDDLDPLKLEPAVRVEIVSPGTALPGDADLVILAGTKSTTGDLAYIRDQGWDVDIMAHHRRGGRVLGICGGYQMLGRTVSDPQGIEGPPGTVDGLGLLDVDTVMKPEKRLAVVSGHHIDSGETITGYEIHIGTTTGPDQERPVFHIDGRPEGAASPDGRVSGAYLHGMFSEDGFRSAFLRAMGTSGGGVGYEAGVDATLDTLAGHLETHVNIEGLLSLLK